MIPRDESALRRRCARYGGLAGALLLALVAYRGGVLPGPPPSSTPGSIWRGADGPLILLGWLAGTALLTGAWWALRRDAPPLRWSAVTVGLWLLPLLLAPPLGSRDIYSYACQGWVFAAGGDPYGPGVAAQGCPWVESVALLWRDTPAPYGPVFMLLAGAAAVAGRFPGRHAGRAAADRAGRGGADRGLPAGAGPARRGPSAPGLLARCLPAPWSGCTWSPVRTTTR